MSVSDHELRSVLDDLYTTCLDGRDRFLVACRYTAADSELENCLKALARKRRRFSRELEVEIQALGSIPAGNVSLGRSVRRIVAAASSALRKDSVLAQLKECHLGAYFAARDYEAALELDLPPNVDEVLRRHLDALREDKETLRRLATVHGGEEAEARIRETSWGRLDYFGMSHVGKERSVNQDQFLIAELRRSMLVQQGSLPFDEHETLHGDVSSQLLVVADGMGGHAAGETASAIAVETVKAQLLETVPWFFHLDSGDEARLRRALKCALRSCQGAIFASQRDHPEFTGMGTTLTMACVIWPKVFVVHAGDSRCYIQRDCRLERITTDHRLTHPPEGGTAGARGGQVLWNALGGFGDDLTVEVDSADLCFGDKLLLCSDGLNEHVSDVEILDVLRAGRSARESVRILVERTLDAGGSDNVTVVVGQFHGDPEKAELESVT